MKIAALQLDIAWENRKKNYERVSEFASKAKDNDADFLVLPEMFATGFSMNPKITAEDYNGETATFIKQLANQYEIGVLGGLVFNGLNKKGRNSAMAVDRTGKDLGIYAKTHLFAFMNEDKVHEPGDGPKIFEFEGIKCAAFICYDLRFPELFRLVANECDVIFVIASWPAARQTHWDIMLPSRAVENQLYIVGVNRVGKGKDIQFSGGSTIISPRGETLASQKDSECLLFADIDLKKVKETRKLMPFLNDRRF